MARRDTGLVGHSTVGSQREIQILILRKDIANNSFAIFSDRLAGRSGAVAWWCLPTPEEYLTSRRDLQVSLA